MLKRIAVFGDRQVSWESSGRVRFGLPAPFETMPVTWERAFGGCDFRVPLPEPLTDGLKIQLHHDHPGLYPRNPFGRGYAVLPDPVDDFFLPNLEDPDDLLADGRLITGDPRLWYTRPLPWTFDWMHPVAFPRYLYMGLDADAWFPGPQDRTLPEVARGYLRESYRDDFKRNPQQFIERWLAGAVVADGQLAHADQAVDEDQVTAHAAGERGRRQVVAAGVAIRGQAFLAQRVDLRHQLAGAAGHVVGAQQPDHRGHPGQGVAREHRRRHPAGKPRLAAAAGDMHVAVDQARQQPAAFQVNDLRAERIRQSGRIAAHPEDLPAAEQQVLAAKGFGCEDVGVAEEGGGHGRILRHRGWRAGISGRSAPSPGWKRRPAPAWPGRRCRWSWRRRAARW